LIFENTIYIIGTKNNNTTTTNNKQQKMTTSIKDTVRREGARLKVKQWEECHTTSRVRVVKANLLVAKTMEYLDDDDDEDKFITWEQKEGEEGQEIQKGVQEQHYITTMDVLMLISRIVIPFEKIKVRYLKTMIDYSKGVDIKNMKNKSVWFDHLKDLYFNNLIKGGGKGSFLNILELAKIYDTLTEDGRGVLWQQPQDYMDHLKGQLDGIEGMYEMFNKILDE